MDKRIEMLRDWGCDINGAMERMLGDEKFYIDCLQAIPSDRNFTDLTEALVNQNTKLAFNSAHTLKGVLINLGLTPMYQKAVEIVEPLRNGESKGLLQKNTELLQMRDELAVILAAR